MSRRSRAFALPVGLILLLLFLSGYGEDSPDGSVCFNKCSGHGSCIDYSCHCFIGYSGSYPPLSIASHLLVLGDDCSVSFVREGDPVIPVLGAGHMNLSSTNFTSVINRNKLALVGFSSRKCHKCIAVEAEYHRISEYLRERKVLFARADADNLKSMSAKFGVSTLPSLVVFVKGRPYPYKGAQTLAAIQAFLEKITSSPFRALDSVEEIDRFIASNRSETMHIRSVNVVAFFRDASSMEEDEFDEFREVAKRLQFTLDIHFAVVTKPSVSRLFIERRVIDRTPSLLLTSEGATYTVNFNELDIVTGLQHWVETRSIPLVAKLDEQNFLLYERVGLPMLLMFLDLADEQLSNSPGLVGGQTGGVLNEVLIQELRATAKEHVGRLFFAYLGEYTLSIAFINKIICGRWKYP